MRSGCAVSATGASESLASVRGGADLGPSASSEASRGGASGASAAGSSRFGSTGSPAFSGAWTSASGSLVGHEGSGSNASVRAALIPSASRKDEARRGHPCGQIPDSIRPASRRFRAPGARVRTLRAARIDHLRRALPTSCLRAQRRPRSPRPTRQSRDSPKIRADGRTSARRTARSAGADQAPGGATRE